MKPLHAQWVVDFYNNMQLASSKSIRKKEFKKALIPDAFNQAEALANCSDNPFIEMDIELSCLLFIKLFMAFFGPLVFYTILLSFRKTVMIMHSLHTVYSCLLSDFICKYTFV